MKYEQSDSSCPYVNHGSQATVIKSDGLGNNLECQEFMRRAFEQPKPKHVVKNIFKLHVCLQFARMTGTTQVAA